MYQKEVSAKNKDTPYDVSFFMKCFLYKTGKSPFWGMRFRFDGIKKIRARAEISIAKSTNIIYNILQMHIVRL